MSGGQGINVDVSTSDYIGPNKSAVDSVFNSSGWTVATSGGKAGAGTDKTFVYIAAALVVGLLVLKMRRK